MEVLKGFVEGDIEAFETLFRQFQGEVYGWILYIVRDSGAAEDLTLETFWRIYQTRTRFDPQASFAPWARRIATNVAIDYLRSRRPEQEFSEDKSPLELPRDSVVESELRDQIACAFRRLPIKLQVPATLALIEERSYQEIADALGKPIGTIRTRVFRAIRLMRKHLNHVGVKP